MDCEIERKWLVSGFCDDVLEYKLYEVEQSYLVSDKNLEVRIRKCTPKNDFACFDNTKPFLLTIKGSGNLVRTEVNISISEEKYNSLVKLLPNNSSPIYKKMRVFDFCGFRIDWSFVDSDFYYAEVEFDSVEKAESYVFPWSELVIREVTYDKNFKMKNYWKSKGGLDG